MMPGMTKPQFQSGGDSFLARIRDRLPETRRAERRLAEFLLDFPGELASYDAQELAKLSGVSKATVSRFVRRIGFDSYDNARRAAREEGRTGSRLWLNQAAAPAAASALPAALAEERDNVAWTYERLDPAEIEACVAAMLRARKVWLVGHRISQSFATYLAWQLVKIVPDVAVAPRGGESLGEHIASMQAEDLVLLFALRRRVGLTDRAIAEIAATGAALAVISDEGMAASPLPRWHFRCRTQTETPQFNHAAVLSLCHWLVVRASDRAGPAARARLRQVEEINERLGFY
jgi:DNA-binding MurR/RpiR family transcriptional regulator